MTTGNPNLPDQHAENELAWLSRNWHFTEGEHQIAAFFNAATGVAELRVDGEIVFRIGPPRDVADSSPA